MKKLTDEEIADLNARVDKLDREVWNGEMTKEMRLSYRKFLMELDKENDLERVNEDLQAKYAGL